MSLLAIEAVRERFPHAIVETHSNWGDDTIVVRAENWLEIAGFLKSDAHMRFDMLTDLCGVDYPERETRFEVVVHLYSTSIGHRLRMKTRVGDSDGDGAQIPTLVNLWPAANWLERETFDLMGITFTGHPDLRRILTYPEFVGHPLRKDYDAAFIQPLVSFRTEAEAGLPLGKLAPFDEHEGMSFARKSAGLDAEND